MLFLERFTDSLFQLIFGRVPSKAAACNSALGHENVCRLKQWALHGVSDCQLVRFPDRHFRMWGKVYFGPSSSNWYVCMSTHTHPYFLPQCFKSSVFNFWKLNWHSSRITGSQSLSRGEGHHSLLWNWVQQLINRTMCIGCFSFHPLHQ